MVVRRRQYDTPWYKKFEKTFVEALSVRFEMIQWKESVPEASVFVAAILPTKLMRKHAAALAEVVHAIDRKAHESK